jgi:DNA-binding MarR family transcriptional regulator
MGSADREAWRLVWELVFAGETAQRLMNVAAQLDLAPGHLKGMFHLEPGDGVPMRDLADLWKCDASYVTSVADGLEERGYVRRLPHPSDRRIKMLALTEEGVAARDRAYEVLFEPPPSFGALSAAEHRQLRDLLRKITDADPRLTRDRGEMAGAAAQARSHAVGETRGERAQRL